MNFHPDLYRTERVWQLYTAYVDKKLLNMKTNWNIRNINKEFASYWLEQLVMVENYNLKPSTENKRLSEKRVQENPV